MKIGRKEILERLSAAQKGDRDQIIEFCHRWKVIELAFFGSILRKDFRPDSDIDVLVTFSSDVSWGLFDHVKMQDELSVIFGRTVDLVSKRAIEKSYNWIRKQSILDSAEIYYAA